MSTKETLIKTIKDWVKLDNEIRSLKKEQSARVNEKKRIIKYTPRNNEIE